jgi:crotonobetainyl-CoA:carnitine CoA-transferase CaiB-like acyl-CoA transferase
MRELRVIDFSRGVPGAYATKLFADAGADVVKVEPADGDPLRRWSAGGEPPGDRDAALFRFLHTSKRSLVGAPDDPEVRQLVADADLMVESGECPGLDPRAWRRRDPRLVVLSLTAWGREGPYAGRPASELTLQAECGSVAGRGLRSQPPLLAGGRITWWVGGTYAAVAALAALRRALDTGVGEHVDFSLLEAMNIAGTMYADLFHGLAGRPLTDAPARTVEIPSIEPTRDGWVGFNTNSRQQYRDFLLLIERTDLLPDEQLASIVGRWQRMDEWNALVREWTTRHTTQEIVEKASLLRIPVAPVNDGRSVLEHEQFRARGVFVKNPDGDFLQPRPPWRLHGETLRPFSPAPRLGEHGGRIEPHVRAAPARPAEPGPALPLAGLRVLDATAWLAGPSATHMLATLGADVIHLEAPRRPDGMRMAGGAFLGRPGWWECSGIFLGANTNKRGLTLDLTDPRGRELLERLLARCDAFVENFSPRVIEQFDLGWERLHAAHPRLVMTRMPAFGLSGPWRDNVGFAQTMEQISGLAWLTGHPEDQPRIQRGPCDPLAGMHAAFATLVGLRRREATGEGCLLECTMVEGALNAAAEQVIEYTAYGRVMQREGNRGPEAAPQNLYACRGEEQWLALAVGSDEQWQSLVELLGSPDWARHPDLASHTGRRREHDRLDAGLSAWAAERELQPTLDALLARGIPAAALTDPRTAHAHPQMSARGFFETVEHPVAGELPTPGVPFRCEGVPRWIRRPAPTFGQHNHEILRELGLGADEIAALEAEQVIAERPVGV